MALNDAPSAMSLADMRTVILFLMSKLSPADLEELDGQLVGEVQPAAMDSRFGDETNRAKMLRLGPLARRAARVLNQAMQAQDASAQLSLKERFPDLDRLRS